MHLKATYQVEVYKGYRSGVSNVQQLPSGQIERLHEESHMEVSFRPFCSRDQLLKQAKLKIVTRKFAFKSSNKACSWSLVKDLGWCCRR